MVFLKEIFEKFDFEKNQQMTKRHAKLPRGQRVKRKGQRVNRKSISQERVNEVPHFCLNILRTQNNYLLETILLSTNNMVEE